MQTHPHSRCPPAALRLHIDDGAWSLEEARGLAPRVLARGRNHMRLIDPFSYRISMSAGTTRMIGRVRKLFRGSMFSGLALQMRPTRASRSRVATLEALAWFRAPFMRTSA